ncbi:hypothetical protein [Silvibacterium acidisoli]|uniref:hypothetical protein n=1 Tax=Acidobacteriaceae bacterium ZG23-2 TaxID=2883246 RepID=UPI00406D3BBD
MASSALFPPVLSVLSLAAQADKSKLTSADPWLMLIDVVWQGQHFRLARNVDDVQFDAGDGFGVQDYTKSAFDLTIERTSGGQLPSIQIKISDIQGLLQGPIQEYAGVVGATVSMYFVNMAHPAGEPSIALTSTIMRTQNVPLESVTFTLGAPKPQQQLFPRYLYRADFCIWVPTYKGKWCGYTGTLPNCDGTYNGSNGCVAHANQQRFGAFPGIGTNGGSLASQT